MLKQAIREELGADQFHLVADSEHVANLMQAEPGIELQDLGLTGGVSLVITEQGIDEVQKAYQMKMEAAIKRNTCSPRKEASMDR
jgi:hypothetical protein